MILVDTSIWIQHLRHGDLFLTSLLEKGEVLSHPWVIGELALGNLRKRGEVLRLLGDLPRALVASEDELIVMIDKEGLYGSGIGYVDAQLLASARLTSDARLWTGERRLAAMAQRFRIGFQPLRG